MTRETAETQSPEIPTIIVGQTFQLLYPRIIPSGIFSEDDQYKRAFSLHIDCALPFLPVEIAFAKVDTPPRREKVFTPADSRLGYQIDQDDFSQHSRQEKFDQNKVALKNPVNKTQDRYLILKMPKGKLKELGLRTEYTLDPDFLELIKRLRFYISIPIEVEGIIQNFSFESEPDQRCLEISAISMFGFYPVESGPLASFVDLARKRRFDKGLTLAFPSDVEMLKKARGQFLLLPPKEDINQEDNEIDELHYS